MFLPPFFCQIRSVAVAALGILRLFAAIPEFCNWLSDFEFRICSSFLLCLQPVFRFRPSSQLSHYQIAKIDD